MKAFSVFIFLALSAIIMLTGCMNLKHVSSYSENALKATRKFDEVNYSFLQYCLDRCEMAAIDSFKIYRMMPCSCNSYTKADSATRAIYQILAAYFDGLSKLANNYTATYRIDPLTRELQNADLGVIQWKKEDAEALSALGDLLLHALTDSYRQQKLRDYIQSANPSLQILLTKLEFIEADNLKGLLAYKKERLFDHYRLLLNDRRLNDYEKQNAAADYYRSKNEIEEQENRLTVYARSLKAVAKGHQKLFDGVDKISGEELKRSLPAYVNDIQDLVSAFDRINTN